MPTVQTAGMSTMLALASARSASGTVPQPSRRSVSRFPPLTDKVEGLPLDERIELRLLAEWVVETHEPANFPVTRIVCVGHADRDFQRGNAFELDISRRRSKAVLQSLERDIHQLSFSFSPVLGISTINGRIRFESTGVGSAEAKPAVNEKQRLRNRRVEIIFERGSPAPVQQPIADILALTKRVINGMFPPIPPVPRPNFFIDITPPRKDEWRELLKALRKSPLRFLDLKAITEGIIDAVGPPETDEERREEWAETLVEAMAEDEQERRNRTLDPPGDPDDDDD